MKSARSLSKLLISGAAVAALVSSCTIQTKTDSNTGGTSSGTTGGNSATTGGSATTTGGAEANTGGSAVTTGGSVATTGGSATTPGGAGGAGGDGTGVGGNPAGGEDAGGQGGAGFDDCDACLDAKCTAEFDACFADSQCISDDFDGSGQFEEIIACTETIRVSRPVKRVDLRTCGTMVSNINSTLWPPEDMTVATLNLVNCLATGQAGEAMNNSWANEANINNVWPASSCAKLACTSQLP